MTLHDSQDLQLLRVSGNTVNLGERILQSRWSPVRKDERLILKLVLVDSKSEMQGWRSERECCPSERYWALIWCIECQYALLSAIPISSEHYSQIPRIGP